MSLELAIRLTEVLLGWAIVQQSAEHLVGPRIERWLFAPRLVCGVFLVIGVFPATTLLPLCALGLASLHHFQGPYNGGSDRMILLILACLTLAHWLPDSATELPMAYLAVQLTLSYFVSGKVKLANPEWRSGRALSDVFAFSAYPVSRELRALSEKPKLLLWASWSVILFELLFPLALITQTTLLVAVCIAALFHLANACLFGLNRFVWAWLAAFPSVIWLQERLLGGGVW